MVRAFLSIVATVPYFISPVMDRPRVNPPKAWVAMPNNLKHQPAVDQLLQDLDSIGGKK